MVVKKISYSALCLALAILLPFLTANNIQLGNMLCLMHIPVLLCGFLCGGYCGLAVGAISPLLRFLIVGMPPLFPVGVPMAFELAAYGFISGLLYKLFPKKPIYTYITLVCAMISGRAVWGAAKFAILGFSGTEFPFSAFVSGAITTALPGIFIQIILIPVIVIALDRAKIGLNK